MSEKREITNEDLYAALVAVLSIAIGNRNLLKGSMRNANQDIGVSAQNAKSRKDAIALIEEMKKHL